MEGAGVQTKLEVTETEIRVVDAGTESQPATLLVMAQPHLEVFLNREQVTGRKTVGGSDAIEVKLYDTPCVRKAWVEIAEDKLQAELHVEYEAGIRRVLRTGPPLADVRLEIREIPVTPQPFELIEIQKILEAEKVSYQVDYAAMTTLLATGGSGSCVCATGTPPVPTEAERYEMTVQDSNELTLIGIIPVRPITSVLEGVVVAQYQPRVEGIPGKNVMGEIVPPDPVVSRLPNLGKGVERSSSGQVVSTRSGRVIFTPGLLDVAETWVMESDLKATDGYVVFDGDVIIRGDVLEGAQISAGGSVFVSGNVSMATISADDGIIVSGGVFASTMKAGMRVSSLQSLASLLDKLCDELSNLANAVSQVRGSLAERGADLPAGKIAAKLLEDRFQEYRSWPKLVESWVSEHGKAAGPTWTKFAESLVAELSYGRLTSVRDVNAWRTLEGLFRNKLDQLPSTSTEPADIQIRNAQSSDLEATGSIVCTNQGYYQCHLVAGQEVRAQGSPGAILASSVVAERVLAREIGTQAETNTTIQLTTTEGSVQATIVHPGTMLSVGAWRHKVSKPMKNVTWP